MTNKQKKIPTNASKLLNGSIPDEVAKINNKNQCYLISFKFYNDKICQIDFLENNNSKKCLKILKTITQTEVGSLKKNNIDNFRILQRGDYKKLFNKLSDDIEIFEHKLHGQSRIFYFTTAQEFNIVAITQNHFETDKSR